MPKAKTEKKLSTVFVDKSLHARVRILAANKEEGLGKTYDRLVRKALAAEEKKANLG